MCVRISQDSPDTPRDDAHRRAQRKSDTAVRHWECSVSPTPAQLDSHWQGTLWITWQASSRCEVMRSGSDLLLLGKGRLGVLVVSILHCDIGEDVQGGGEDESRPLEARQLEAKGWRCPPSLARRVLCLWLVLSRWFLSCPLELGISNL